MFQESQKKSSLLPCYHTASHIHPHLRGGLSDAKSWSNVFHKEITSRINESIYSVLYSADQGRPNASIRVLISMRILKEGQGITDRQLFESCRYHLLYRQALGLVNLSDALPSEATYYNFFKACFEYFNETGIDLLAQTFSCVTKHQVFELKVNGESIRMDSKLIQSNIAFASRLQLFLDVLFKFYKSLTFLEQSSLSQQTQEVLNELIKKKSSTHLYKLSKEEGKDLFTQLGPIGFQLIDLNTDPRTDAYQLLSRFMSEHFLVEENEQDHSSQQGPSQQPSSTEIGNQAKEGISNQVEKKVIALAKPVNGGSSLQSVHDPEASYRNKEGSKKQIIKGYVTNVTETCHPDEKLRLITDVCTKTATASDDTFLQDSIEKTQQITQEKVKAFYTDGAFNSQSNQEWVKNQLQNPQWHITAIQGKEGDFHFQKQGDTYLVTNRITQEKQLAFKTKNGRYRIKIPGKVPYRYFLKKTINNYFIRQRIKKISDQAKGIRANCEASINQMYCKLNGNKSKYRGLFKHQQYALCRAFWVNMTRIKEFFLKISLFKLFLILSYLIKHLTNKGAQKI